MLDYDLYKKNKAKTAAAATTVADQQASTYDKLEAVDSTIPVEGETEVRMLPRSGTQATFTNVKDKDLQMKQWISLGLTMLVDIILPIILYVSLARIQYS
jgi:hypothetical protein